MIKLIGILVVAVGFGLPLPNFRIPPAASPATTSTTTTPIAIQRPLPPSEALGPPPLRAFGACLCYCGCSRASPHLSLIHI